MQTLWYKNVSRTIYRTLLLTEKICVTIRDFIIVLSCGYYGIHELHCGINAYKKKLFWLRKNESFKGQFLYESFSSWPTLSCTITKKPKSFLQHKSNSGCWNSWESWVTVFSLSFSVNGSLLDFWVIESSLSPQWQAFQKVPQWQIPLLGY